MFGICGAVEISDANDCTKRRTDTPSKEPPSGVSGYGTRHDTGRMCFSARLPLADRTGGMRFLVNFSCLKFSGSRRSLGPY
jgi:hypothetical protein